jgi:hypothetical protein
MVDRPDMLQGYWVVDPPWHIELYYVPAGRRECPITEITDECVRVHQYDGAIFWTEEANPPPLEPTFRDILGC